MVSWTHLIEKTLDSNGLMDYIMEKIQMTIYSLTDPSHTANSYPSYLLIVLQKIGSLERKRRRLVAMTMTRSLVKIILFVVHFINNNFLFCHHHQN